MYHSCSNHHSWWGWSYSRLRSLFKWAKWVMFSVANTTSNSRAHITKHFSAFQGEKTTEHAVHSIDYAKYSLSFEKLFLELSNFFVKQQKNSYKKRNIDFQRKKYIFQVIHNVLLYWSIHKSLQTDLHCFWGFLNNSPLCWASDMRQKILFNLWSRWRPESLLKMGPASQFPVCMFFFFVFENAWPDHWYYIYFNICHDNSQRDWHGNVHDIVNVFVVAGYMLCCCSRASTESFYWQYIHNM